MWLVFLGGVGGIITASSGLKASINKIKKIEFERTVSKQEAPALWVMLNEIAEELQTRPVDEVWLLGTTDLAVTEQGSMRQKFKDQAKRVLILGTGAIEQMDQGAFRAILAHEYEHALENKLKLDDLVLGVAPYQEKEFKDRFSPEPREAMQTAYQQASA